MTRMFSGILLLSLAFQDAPINYLVAKFRFPPPVAHIAETLGSQSARRKMMNDFHKIDWNMNRTLGVDSASSDFRCEASELTIFPDVSRRPGTEAWFVNPQSSIKTSASHPTERYQTRQDHGKQEHDTENQREDGEEAVEIY